MLLSFFFCNFQIKSVIKYEIDSMCIKRLQAYIIAKTHFASSALSICFLNSFAHIEIQFRNMFIKNRKIHYGYRS